MWRDFKFKLKVSFGILWKIMVALFTIKWLIRVEKVNWSSNHVICILVGMVIWTSTSAMSSFPFQLVQSNFKFEWCYFDCVHCDFKFIWRDFDMDSLIFKLQIVLYFQLFLSANVRHTPFFPAPHLLAFDACHAKLSLCTVQYWQEPWSLPPLGCPYGQIEQKNRRRIKK